jgi:hypothetical protein
MDGGAAWTRVLASELASTSSGSGRASSIVLKYVSNRLRSKEALELLSSFSSQVTSRNGVVATNSGWSVNFEKDASRQRLMLEVQ